MPLIRCPPRNSLIFPGVVSHGSVCVSSRRCLLTLSPLVLTACGSVARRPRPAATPGTSEPELPGPLGARPAPMACPAVPRQVPDRRCVRSHRAHRRRRPRRAPPRACRRAAPAVAARAAAVAAAAPAVARAARASRRSNRAERRGLGPRGYDMGGTLDGRARTAHVCSGTDPVRSAQPCSPDGDQAHPAGRHVGHLVAFPGLGRPGSPRTATPSPASGRRTGPPASAGPPPSSPPTRAVPRARPVPPRRTGPAGRGWPGGQLDPPCRSRAMKRTWAGCVWTWRAMQIDRADYAVLAVADPDTVVAIIGCRLPSASSTGPTPRSPWSGSGGRGGQGDSNGSVDLARPRLLRLSYLQQGEHRVQERLAGLLLLGLSDAEECDSCHAVDNCSL